MLAFKNSICTIALVVVLITQTPCATVIHAAEQQAAAPSLAPALNAKQQSADKDQKQQEQNATASSQAWSVVKYTGACVAIVYAAGAIVALAVYSRIKDLLPAEGRAHNNDDDEG